MADGFGALLRRHRTAAVLTQERLAELAGISATGIAALESGRRRAPRPSTVALLLDALALQGDARAELIAAAASDAAPAPPGRAEAGAARAPTPAGARATTGILGDTPNLSPRAAFVGRPDERARLLGAWQRRTRVVVVAGEAGVGKTRLVSELARALDPEATVLWGRCTPDRLGVYEPFVGPLREVLRRAPDGGERVGDLARLVPELVNERGWTDATRSADPDVERRLLFEAAGALLADLGPTLLVLDDMHWADSGSLALLAHLAARAALDVVIVVTVRTTDQDAANAAALAELRRHATVERLTLQGLDRGDVAALVGELAGDRSSRALVDAVVGATEGNPLFVEELTEHLVALGFGGDGAGNTPATSLPVPTGVRETLTQRLGTLSPDAQSLLRTGAVLGRTFDADLAAGLADLPPTHVLGATEDALLSRLVTEHSARELSFSHGLVQLAVYETISARRRLDLHRRAAETLAAPDGTAPLPDAVVFAVARHWETVARSDPSAASASAWCRRAGDAAAAAADIGEAIVRYERAVRLGAGTAAEQCETLLRLGAALSARSRWEEADERFRAALALADERGDPLHAARAAIGLASTVRYGHSDPERIAALERALADLPDGEEVLRTMAAAMLKRQLGFDLSDDAYHRRQAAARIVLDAVSRDDLSTELLLTLGQARDAITVDDPRVLARLSRLTVAAASAERKLQVLAHGWFGQAWAAFELADGAAWTTATAAFDAVAHELDLPFELGMASTMAATTALMHGRYDDAERLSERAFSLSSGADPNAPTIHLTAGVIRGVDLGHGHDMVELMAASRAELALVPTFMAGFTAVAALAGATDLARELLDEHARVGFGHVRRDLEWLPVMGFLCHAAAVVGAVEHAPELHDLLDQHPARAVRVGPLAGWWGPTDHHLGALCRVMGRLPEAEERLRRAVTTCDELGARPWAARCRLELARIVEMRADAVTAEVAGLRADAARAVAEIGAKGVSLA